MLEAIDVARQLLRLGYDCERPEESVLVGRQRLQNLLYFCQGWALGLLGRPLFRDPIDADSEGPVVRSILTAFQGSAAAICAGEIPEPDRRLTKTESALVKMIWKEYVPYTPLELSRLVQSEPAWVAAREDSHSSQLSVEALARSFSHLAKSQSYRAGPGSPLVEPAEVWQLEERDEQNGETSTPAEDVFRSLLSKCQEQAALAPACQS